MRSTLIRTQQAIAALEGAQIERLPDVIRRLEEQTTRAAQLADALADDYESLLAELEIQREVTLRLCAAAADMPVGSTLVHSWRDFESSERLRVLEEREQKNAESTISKEA